MRNLNNRGFALVETLIVSAFVMGIFSLLYNNFYPLIGEYEKRETYDTIDSVYKTDLWKRFLTKYKTNLTGVDLKGNADFQRIFLGETGKTSFCNMIPNTLGREKCNLLWNNLNVNSIILCSYTTTWLKDNIKANNTEGLQGMKEYVDYLSKFETNSQQYRGRIIVEYKETIDISSEKSYDIFKYATLGVDLYD